MTTVALNNLYANIYSAYISKQKSNREKQVILLMLPNEEGLHCITVEKITCINKRSNIEISR